jgi:kynurenine formamidase
MTYNDDIFQGWFGIGPQIDGLGHLGDQGMYYNCNHARDFAGVAGLTKLGIEKVPPIVARGIVLDMAAHFGVEHMDGGQTFSVDDVKAVERKQKTPVQEGDVVLFHTGWTDAKLKSDPDTWASVEPGLSDGVASYLASKDVVAVGADTWGVDVVPSVREDQPFIGHQILIMKNGIYIFETMNTGPLVRDGALEFLFVLGQAKVRGAVQMIINPIAIR